MKTVELTKEFLSSLIPCDVKFRWQQQQQIHQTNRLRDAKRLGIFASDLDRRRACSFQTTSIRNASQSTTYDAVKQKCTNSDQQRINVPMAHTANRPLASVPQSNNRNQEAADARIQQTPLLSTQVGEPDSGGRNS